MRPDRHSRLQLSLLDRLIDQPRHEPALVRIRQGIRRDLERLLNARRSWLTWPSRWAELDQSVLGYGLPDFTVMELSTEEGKNWLCREVEQTIARFEPRLTRVKVRVQETRAPLDRLLRLRIEAVLLVDPAPQPVAFDSELDPLNLSLSLQDCA